ncbi:MAG: hypothetical protein BA863_08625 [Desulfovibrio sp. S3730MH75]|nr:MAG: hypothetical protein BA863_08625 [Desulfovibrio sp. S3730MH75]
MKNYIDKCSAQFLIKGTGRAIERAEATPDHINLEIATNMLNRLSVYYLSQAGAKYAGEHEGPRRNHG